MTFDSTGCFHWCSAREVEECTLTRLPDDDDGDYNQAMWLMPSYSSEKNTLLPSVLMVITIMMDDDDTILLSCGRFSFFHILFISNIIITIIITIIYRQEATMTMFAGHVIVAIFAEPDSPLLGLRWRRELPVFLSLEIWKCFRSCSLFLQKSDHTFKIMFLEIWSCHWGRRTSTTAIFGTLFLSGTLSSWKGGENISVVQYSATHFAKP